MTAHDDPYEILADVRAERRAQDALFGDGPDGEIQNTPLLWLAVLAEEFGEVAREVTAITSRMDRRRVNASVGRLDTELVQVAAVAVAWLEAIRSIHRCALADANCEGAVREIPFGAVCGWHSAMAEKEPYLDR